VGEWFEDTGAGIALRTVSLSEAGAVVRVAFREQGCVTANPRVMVEDDTLCGAPGATVNVSVSVTSQHAAGCERAMFTLLAATNPEGEPDHAEALALESSEQRTVTFQVQLPETPGEHRLKVRVISTLDPSVFGGAPAQLLVLDASVDADVSCANVTAPAAEPTPPTDAPPSPIEEPNVSGAIFHAANCTPDNPAERLVVFAPGTAGGAAGAQHFIQQVGDATGLCAIAVAYDNAETILGCCKLGDDPDGPQDPACFEAIVGAKSAAHPSSYTCTDGSVHQVPQSASIEGATTAAVVGLGLDTFLSKGVDSAAVDWTKVILTGHSQGSLLAIHIGYARHALAGIGSIGGGNPLLYEAPLTSPLRHRAFHHVDDHDLLRRHEYAKQGVTAAQIRTTTLGSKSLNGYGSLDACLDDQLTEGMTLQEAKSTCHCMTDPHTCVISKHKTPVLGGVPAFAPFWLWLVGHEIDL
jgi:hypothetical protein